MRRHAVPSLAVLIGLLLPPVAPAQSYTWTLGAATDDWNTPGNWSPNTSFPNSPTATVTFPGCRFATTAIAPSAGVWRRALVRRL